VIDIRRNDEPVRFDETLRGGNARSLGRTSEVVEAVLTSPQRLPELLHCLVDADDVVRMRAGDALEKVARQEPDWIRPLLDRLLTTLAHSQQPSLQWHLAQILEEVPLTPGQRRQAVRFLKTTLKESDDWIVLTCVMQSLTTLASADPELRTWLIPRLRRQLEDRRPAVAKRAEKQLTRLSRQSSSGRRSHPATRPVPCISTKGGTA
jgi:HEAT repeat protein